MEAFRQRVLALTHDLARIRSDNPEGQRKAAARLLQEVIAIPYFAAHPECARLVKTGSGSGELHSVLALYREPFAAGTRAAVVFGGHLDTVGVEQAARRTGIAEAAFFAPDGLPELLRPALAPDADLQADLASGEWMCGRGVFDMKGGCAVAVELLRHLTQCGFPWNVVLLITADEERESAGIKSALPELAQLASEGFDFRLLLNFDYTSPLVPGDGSAYVYTGTIGKLLLGVTVQGDETHAGAPFEGVNAAALLAAILAHLEGNPKLTQHVKGDFTPPPAVLCADARQEKYAVTTPAYARGYVNVFFARHNYREYLREVANEVRRACRLHYQQLKRRYQRMVARADLQLLHRLVRPEVITYSTLITRLGKLPRAAEPAAAYSVPGEAAEPRLACLEAAERALQKLAPARPTVVLSLLPPLYIPYTMADDAEAKPLLAAARELARNWHGPPPVKHLRQRNYYPYISDLSFAVLPTDGLLAPLLAECPLPELLALPVAEHRVRMPVMNLGPWGKDAHRAAERVHVPFLTRDLPRMCLRLLGQLAGTRLPEPE